MRWWIGIILMGGLVGSGVAYADEVDFARIVRPVLAEHCFACHGPDPGTRKASLRLDTPEGLASVIVAGDAGASELIARLRHPDPEERMPPPAAKTRPSDAEIDGIAAWMKSGALYEVHWAFRPIDDPPPPAPGGGAGTEIDAFIDRMLASRGLPTAPPAEPATLIRRICLDLTGLPPTPEDVDAFLADPDDDAYERLVDRLLASPHFGERWARPWLDAARYADTKGYEADRRRTMWPYRDWVVRTLNDDMPFDQFTIEQLAGDLLPDPTLDQLIATAFHRNTMTNDEGGTDDEEFRHAAVVDRVNTTMQTWMGLSMACAQCHAHKYDPFPHDEYYRLFAFFNSTEDADQMDERPTLAVPSRDERWRRQTLAVRRTVLDRERGRLLATATAGYVDPHPDGLQRLPAPVVELVWLDDDVPRGGKAEPADDVDAWRWTDDATLVAYGERALVRSAGAGRIVQSFFTEAAEPLEVAGGDELFVYVFLDAEDPPSQIMLQWHTPDTGWEHRATWGDDVIPWGTRDTASRRHLGPLPETGGWVRLGVDAVALGFDRVTALDGIAFSQVGGTVRWDAAGVSGPRPRDETHRRSYRVWCDRRAGANQDVPDLEQYLLTVHHRADETFADVRRALAAVDEETQTLANGTPRLPVMRELATPRVTQVAERGSFLASGDVVTPGVPAVFPPLGADAPRSRLGLARWLVAEDNPLTARVHANRVWAELFGRGLVTTPEDFGIRGATPSHPELLDHLAQRLMDDGWHTKTLIKRIVLSNAYRRSSRVDPAVRREDPENRWLGRMTRRRLDAETVRDQALAASGLLDRTMGGPPVFPPQPDGLWQVVYSDDRWQTSEGGDRHRRALYTFWRRTMPYPSLVMFDAPSREVCVVRRIGTNTPFQSLVTLNDPVYVEAAQALARRVRDEAGESPRARATRAFRLVVARTPAPRELDELTRVYTETRARYANDIAAARAAAGVAEDADLADETIVDLAAWTIVSSIVLNLDEALTRG